MANDMDFIGFKYNGTHSSYYEIFRTSDGSRYNDNLIPQLMDKTADVPGGEGQYYFGSSYKTRQFSISIAFENLNEEKYREMRTWLDGKGIHDLVFDEAPYKVYSAKVTGTPQLKTICFEKDGARVYKGEGTIQFTCYYPYAHTPKLTDSGGDGRALNNYNVTHYPNKSEWAAASGLTSLFTPGMNKGDLPTPFVLKVVNQNYIFSAGTKIKVGSLIIVPQVNAREIVWDSKTGLITGKVQQSNGQWVEKALLYTGKSYGAIPVNGIELTDIYVEVEEATIKYRYYPNKTKVRLNESGNPSGSPSTIADELFTIEYNYQYY